MHVPFCAHKCHYCDFYSIVDTHGRQQTFVDRLREELAAAGPLLPGPVETIFVGGGTPTLLEAERWSELLPALYEHLPLAPEVEFTVEANPETVTAELARVLARGGVNRISLGAQSFNRQHLKTLERHHEPANVARSVQRVRAAGIERINLDLIFGIPGQSLDDWKNDLETALALRPAHLSCYGLTYEPNTALTRRMTMGRITPIAEPLEAAMYEYTIARLEESGFEHYEVSAWAKPGERCRHNLRYWEGGEWWPFGPSAAGHLAGLRWKNVPRLTEYLDHGPLPRIQDVEHITAEAALSETLMMGLRLRDGIARGRLEPLLAGAAGGRERRETIDRFVRQGQLEWRGEALRLTGGGLMVADSVLVELI